MSNRTTKADLDLYLTLLNGYAAELDLKARYTLYSAYGKTRIQRDGRDVTPLGTKREAYNALVAMVDLLERQVFGRGDVG